MLYLHLDLAQMWVWLKAKCIWPFFFKRIYLNLNLTNMPLETPEHDILSGDHTFVTFN